MSNTPASTYHPLNPGQPTHLLPCLCLLPYSCILLKAIRSSRDAPAKHVCSFLSLTQSSRAVRWSYYYTSKRGRVFFHNQSREWPLNKGETCKHRGNFRRPLISIRWDNLLEKLGRQIMMITKHKHIHWENLWWLTNCEPERSHKSIKGPIVSSSKIAMLSASLVASASRSTDQGYKSSPFPRLLRGNHWPNWSPKVTSRMTQ